jgi:3-hydroxy-9,10-secoandrosta-1,3,5(10)-triene-9,17-dione monooxygenase reductase component
MSALPVALDVRSAASRFPSGVALVTAPGGDALVVDSFVSVSLDPPLISFSPARASLTWHRMRRAGRFGVNVLGVAHGDDLRERARPGADRLAGLDVRRTAGGVARVMDARAFFECVLEAEHAAGDHTIVVGRVIAVHDGAGEPLVFADGAFGRVAPLSTAPGSA